jgi:hypothetical protein
MEVCSSTEMGAPGASHLGTGDRGPKNRPKQTTISPGKRASVRPFFCKKLENKAK